MIFVMTTNDSHEALSLQYRRVLSIGGSDSGCGAGIQAELKTIAALCCYDMIALTAQKTVGVNAIHSVPPEIVKARILAVVEDIDVDAAKIGMLQSPEIVDAVAWAIERYQLKQVVLDPVVVARHLCRPQTDRPGMPGVAAANLMRLR